MNRLLPPSAAVLLLGAILLAFTPVSAQAQVAPDLTVAIAQPDNPARYAVYETTVTVVNEGFAPATDVIVDVPPPEGVVYEGGNEFVASQGRFTTFGERRGQWRVGSIGAQARATLTIRYYLLAPAAPVGYAQVLSQNESDADSTPGNGTPPAVNEDDEASTALGTGNSGPPCEIASEILSVDCDDAGTPGNPGDDTYSVTFVVTNGGATGEWLSEFATSIAARGTYGEPFTYRAGLIEFAGFNPSLLGIRDALDRTCATRVNWRDLIPEPCSEGTTPTSADLSLALSRPGDPAPFTNYTLTATLHNDGPAAATGVVVSVPFDQGAGAVFSGGDEFDVSQGSYSPYGRQRWTVGTLAPGAEATITLNLFRLRGELPTRYAQVVASEQDDPDSTPGNGAPPTVKEDDEASTAEPDAGGDEMPNLGLGLLYFPEDPRTSTGRITYTYDVFNSTFAPVTERFAVVAYVSEDGDLSPDDRPVDTIFYDGFDATSSLGEADGSFSREGFAPGDYTLFLVVDDGDRVAEVTEADNVGSLDFTLPDTDLPCDLELEVVAVECDDAGTPSDPDDDRFTLDIRVTNGEAAGTWEYVTFPIREPGSVVQARGNYGETFTFGPTRISGAGLFTSILVVRDSLNPTCTDRIDFLDFAPPPCSEGDPAADTYDLELTATSADPTPDRFAVTPITYTLTNTGGQPFRGELTVILDLPGGTVFEGGNEGSATAGRFEPLFPASGAWSLTELPAGESESLTVNFYALEPGGYVAYAQVARAVSSDGLRDADSTPNNGDGATAREDDEVALDLRYGAAFGSRSAGLSLAPSVAPSGTPVSAHLRDVTIAGPAELLVTEIGGRVVERRTVELLPGDNAVTLATERLAPGVYVVAAPGVGATPVRLVVR